MGGPLADVMDRPMDAAETALLLLRDEAGAIHKEARMPFPQGPFYAKLGAEDMRELAICAEARGGSLDAAAEAALALELAAARCFVCVALHAGGVWTAGSEAEALAAWSELKAWSRAGSAYRAVLRWKRLLSARLGSRLWGRGSNPSPVSGSPAASGVSGGSYSADRDLPEDSEGPSGGDGDERFEAADFAVQGSALQSLESLCGGDPDKVAMVLSRAVRRLELLDAVASLGGELGGEVRGNGGLREIRVWEV